MKNKNLTHIFVNVKGKVHKICVSVLPAAAIVAFVSTVMYWNSRNYGLALAYAGKEIATVQDENVFAKATKLVQEQIGLNKNVDTSIPSPECKLKIINSSEYVSPNAVKDKLLQESQAAIENAFGLYVDGKLIGIVKDKNLLDDLLKNTLNTAKGTDIEATSEFVEKVEVVEGFYLSSEICEISSLNKAIYSGIEYETEYEVMPDDTLESIAEKFDVSVDSIYKNNNIENSEIKVGQSLCIVYFNKVVHVKVCKNEMCTREIPFSSSAFDDPNEFVGTQRVVQTGENGIEQATEKVTYIDGVEVLRETVESTVLLQPTEEHIAVGSKPKTSSQGSGVFCWPVPFTKNVTSGYGDRDGSFHKGIDIASSGVGGKEIVAAADGVIMTVSNGGGYGNYVRIKHDNNTCTLYAHCKSVSVKNGQKVSKGDVIASVGSTGNSTGNHLHFEVIVNDKNVDPIKYFK